MVYSQVVQGKVHSNRFDLLENPLVLVNPEPKDNSWASLNETHFNQYTVYCCNRTTENQPVLHRGLVPQEDQTLLSVLLFHYIHPNQDNQDLQLDLDDPEHTKGNSQPDISEADPVK